MDPDQTTQTDQTNQPSTDQTVPPEPTPVPENPEPIPATETPATYPNPPDTPNPPDVSTPSAEVSPPPVESPVPEPQPPSPSITPINIPVPNFRFPFNGNFPVTFPFNSQPTSEELKQKFQQWGISGHHGIDFSLPEGTEVVAVDSGDVIQSGENGDYGNSVTIQHPWGQSLYAHLQETKVSVDQTVNAGDLIGLSGQTGSGAFGPHLHFGIKPNNTDNSNGFLGFIDPSPYLPAVTKAEEGLSPIPQITPIPPTPPVTQPEAKPEEVKPPEPEPQQQPPPIPEPTIDIKPISQPISPAPQIPPTDNVPNDSDKFKEFLKLGNPAKQEKRDEHLKKIIAFAQEKKEITNQDVRDLVHVSQTTATRYLEQLVNQGVLKINKKAKATTYLF